MTDLISRTALEESLRHAMRVRSLYNGETPLDDYGRRIVGEVLRLVLEFPAVTTTKGRPLTTRQASVLKYLAEYITANGHAPNQNQIASHFGFRSLATVVEHLDNLAAKGWIRREFNTANGTSLTPDAVAWFQSLPPPDPT